MDDATWDALRSRVWLKLGKEGRCPMCAAPNPWGGADVLVRFPVAVHDDRQPKANGRIKQDEQGNPMLTTVQIYCINCGFLAFLDVEPLLEEG